MLNDNKSIENKQINVISPLVKKIMKFNSIFLICSMIATQIFIIIKFYLHFRILPVSITHRGRTIQQGFQHLLEISGEGLLLGFFLICFVTCFFNYGISTFRYLKGKGDLLNKSIKLGFFSLAIACIESFAIIRLFYNMPMLIVFLCSILILPVLFNLIQLHKTV